MIGKQYRTVFETRRKSRLTAYVLWLLLGVAGAHRFYLRMKPSGFGMLALVCVAAATFFARHLPGFTDEILIVSGTTLLLLVTWVLADALRVPGFVQAYNDRLIRQLSGGREQWRSRRPQRNWPRP